MTMTAPAAPRPPTERRFWLASLGLILAIAAATGLVILRGSTVSIGVATTPASGATISGQGADRPHLPGGDAAGSPSRRACTIEPALPARGRGT